MHHFNKLRKEDPDYYPSFVYEEQLWRMTRGYKNQQESKARLESLVSSDSYEFNMGNSYLYGFAYSIHYDRPYSESLWWLNHYYQGILTHFKVHLHPDISHPFELAFDGIRINRKGRQLNSYLRNGDWLKAVTMALFFNDKQGLELLKQFSKNDIALDENVQYMSPFKYSEFDLMQALLSFDGTRIEIALKEYMSIEFPTNPPGDSVPHIEALDIPLMNVMMAVFCQRGQEKYQEAVADAIKRYAAYSKKRDYRQLDFPLDLIGLAQCARRELGYTFPDHPYFPEWFQTVDITDITQPRKVHEQPDEFTWKAPELN
ncbi:hypothetical protein L2734_16980 [Parashewanella spongiae]|uniref:hypothetical protein n=1 Tax=Parashewanella spongiae TaxID=342950 RepID=UPI000EF968CB|nr:hypothetical protein [Parashewanella spongiae]MCL1079833.1 hypothetical protein [Parashewanella spongiae]